MRNLILILAIIGAVFGLAFYAVLEKPEDQARFHIDVPLPADADTADVDEGIYGGRVLIGELGDPKTLNPVVATETSSTNTTNSLSTTAAPASNPTNT